MGGYQATSTLPTLPASAGPSPLFISAPTPGSTSNALTDIPRQFTASSAGIPIQYPVRIQFAPSSLNKMTSHFRHVEYISTSNTLISVIVTPLGGSPTTNGPTACTAGSCTITFTAAPGPNTLTFQLTDGSNLVLSTFTSTVIVQPVLLNTFTFTANPIVNSVDVQLGSTTVSTGGSATIPLTINARDPDGNIIVGTGNYVNAAGDPLALNITVQTSQDLGSGAISLQGPTKLTSANHPAINVFYNGGWFSSSFIALSSSKTIAGSLGSATLTSNPTNSITYTLTTAGSYPSRITSGNDGNVWVTEQVTNKIAKVSLNGTITEYPVPTVSSGPQGITNGPDGNIWFTEGNTNKIGRITASGTITEYITPTGSSDPNDITTGPDGNLWFTEYGQNKIGRITLSGSISEYTVPGPAYQPHFITAGSDGKLWFTEDSNNIGQITTTGTITQYSVPTASSLPQGIASGPDGNVWFVEWNGNKVGKITPSGTISEYTIPTSSANPISITPGPDGYLWFTEYNASKIGQISTAGVINDFSLNATAISPSGLTFGSDGNIWFCENGVNKVSRFMY